MHEKEITCQETLETDLPFYGRSPSFAFLRDRAFPHSRNIFLLFRWKKKMRKIEVKVNFTNFYNTFSIATYFKWLSFLGYKNSKFCGSKTNLVFKRRKKYKLDLVTLARLNYKRRRNLPLVNFVQQCIYFFPPYQLQLKKVLAPSNRHCCFCNFQVNVYTFQQWKRKKLASLFKVRCYRTTNCLG